MLTAVGILIAAVLADAVLGDPVYPWHPVRLMGRSVTALEAGLRRCGWPGYGGGALLLIVELALWGGGSGLLLTLLKTASWPLQALLAVFLLYSCIALTDLCRHAQPVARALQENDLERARARVQMIVGRNAALLDAPGVARAAVESVAEGFVDGYLSPLFWFATAAVAAAAAGLDPVTWGAAAAVGYRTTNTLDSMVGYRNQRYQRFGTASARCDDLVNFIPARLAVPILTLAAFLTGADAGACWRIGRRDRLKHASPNAGHAESCVAGALGLRLGGPTVYAYGTVDKPWLGDGPGLADLRSIGRCCRLVRAGGGIAVVFFAAVLTACCAAGG